MYQFAFPPTEQEGFLFSTPCPAFIVCRIFDDGHSDWCDMIPHVVLICISLITSSVDQEKEMATHSSILALRVPGTEEPGGLPSMGSHRVGHD